MCFYCVVSRGYRYTALDTALHTYHVDVPRRTCKAVISISIIYICLLGIPIRDFHVEATKSSKRRPPRRESETTARRQPVTRRRDDHDDHDTPTHAALHTHTQTQTQAASTPLSQTDESHLPFASRCALSPRAITLSINEESTTHRSVQVFHCRP